MDKKIIIIYEWQFQNLLRQSVNRKVEVLEWVEAEWLSEKLEDLVERIYTYYEGVDGGDLITCIMVSSRELKKIAMLLLQALGVDESSILDVYKAYLSDFSRMRYQRIMNRKKNFVMDGIILGISHGMVGIIEEKMPGTVCNLCESSQDIYFNYRVLKGVCEEYYTNICNLTQTSHLNKCLCTLKIQ